MPSIHREEWRREWSAELWHVRRSYVSVDDTYSWESQREITAFCLGAFPDALCLRSQPAKGNTAPVHIHGSAAHTLLWLSAALALCFVDLPPAPRRRGGKRSRALPDQAQRAPHQRSRCRHNNPSISAALYQNWKMTRQRFFQELAFYRVSRETAEAGSAAMPWSVAHSTRNLFQLLGLPINFAERADDADSSLPAAHPQPRHLDALLRRQPAHRRTRPTHWPQPGENCRRGSRWWLAAPRSTRCMAPRIRHSNRLGFRCPDQRLSFRPALCPRSGRDVRSRHLDQRT